MSPFDRLSPERIAAHIQGAAEIVVFSASSLTDAIAKALIAAAARLAPGRVIVLLDTSEDVLRMGYGEANAVKALLGKPEVILREADGLRINTLICDHAAWVFSSPPMAIESQDVPEGGFNAVVLTSDQRRKILDAINPAHDNPDLNPADVGCEATDQSPAIGANPVYIEDIEEVLENIERNPPRPFDLTRLVNVYQAKIEFVELELRGARIHQHRIQLPDALKALLANDKEAQRRINATYQVIDGESEVSGEHLDQQIKEIRKTYLSPLKNIGTVLLKEHRKSFEEDLEALKAEIETFKKTLQDKIQTEIQKNVASLSDVFAKLIAEQKPKVFVHKVSGDLNIEKAKKIAEDLLLKQIPSAEKLAGNIELRCLYKDVTIEMLRNKEFQEQVRAAFPHSGWELPYDESQAAPMQQELDLKSA